MTPNSPQKHPILTWFASNPVVANLLMLVILGGGLYVASDIRREAFPAIPDNSVTIQVPFNGGVPEDVERGVAIKIEEALQNVDGIDHVRSTSTSSGATINVSAAENHSPSQLFNDIKVQVDSISTFPSEAERPVITENKDLTNVIRIDVHGDVPEAVLKETARTIKDELLKHQDIREVQTIGTRDYEISIEVSEEKLRQYDLTFDEVADAVRNNSIDLSGGILHSSRGDISLRARTQAYTGADFQKIPLRTNENGIHLFLADVATISDAFVDQKILSRFNGQPTIGLQIVTNGKSDIVKASDQAREFAINYSKSPNLPEGVSLTAWNDGAEPIRSRLALLTENGLQGIILVLISLSLFLNIRLAFWVALGIPVSVAGALILFGLPGIDISLNMITAFSFIIVLGIVVDDAIVLGESVYEEKEKQHSNENGVAAIQTTIRGISRVVTPATFGVLTTIAAFFPLTLIPGGMGEAFGQIAYGVIFCLIFSLIESKLILPAHLAHLNVHNQSSNHLSRLFQSMRAGVATVLDHTVKRIYQPTVKLAMNYRYLTASLFLSILILFSSLLPSGHLRFVFFPNIFNDEVTATLILEEGLPADELHRQTLRLADALQSVYEEIHTELGENVGRHIQITARNNTEATIVANLTPSEERSINSGEIINLWREKIGHIQGARSLNFSGTSGPPGQDLSIQLEGDNLETLQAAAAKLRNTLATYPGVFDPRDDFKTGRPEIQIDLTPTGRASGFERRDLANAVRSAFYGIEAQRIQRGRDEVKTMVKLSADERSQLNTLRNMRVRSSDGSALPFEIVAETRFGESLASINRADFSRVVTVTADLDKTLTSGEEVTSRLGKEFFPSLKSQFPGVNVSLRGEAEESSRALTSLLKGLFLSLSLIYILLAIPLKSYVKPFLIMSVIPFGIIGALIGHVLLGIPVSILSILGILSLSGIVVNDSLVMICRINDLRSDNDITLHQATLQAGTQRFRAILLTTFTTFIGLIPILMESSIQAQFLKPMAISIAFGILFLTLITLILLPVLLVITDETLGASFRYYRQILTKHPDSHLSHTAHSS